MSGGHFDYLQGKIELEVEKFEAENNETYSLETLERFQLTMQILKVGAAMLQRVDWLVSDDDSEETFHKRWEQDGLNKYDFILKENEYLKDLLVALNSGDILLTFREGTPYYKEGEEKLKKLFEKYLTKGK